MKFQMALTFIVLIGYSPINAQNTMNEAISSIPQYFNRKDIKKAEVIIASINADSLMLQPDSTRYLYHYYAAAVDEIKNVDTEGKAEHLKMAKFYLETLPSLGIGIHSYPEVCYALGNVYQALNHNDDAVKAWEDGIVKCLTIYGTFDKKQKQDFYSMINDLANLYEKLGKVELANKLKAINPPIDKYSIENVSNLIKNALKLTELHQSEEALQLLNEAEVILPKVGEPDFQLIYIPIYGNKAYALADLGKTKDVIENLKKLKDYYQQNKIDKWFSSYIEDINHCAVLLSMNENYDGASEIIQFSKNESKKNDLPADSTILKYERQNNIFKSLKLKNDSLEVLFSKTKDKDEWISVGCKLVDVYSRRSKYEKALNTSINLYDKTKDDKNLIKFYMKTLKLVVTYSVICKKYDLAYPYILKYEELMLEQYGHDSKQYLEIRNQHGIATMTNHPLESRKCLKDAYDITIKMFGDNSKETIFILHNLGRLCQIEKKYDEAYNLLSKSKELQLKFNGQVIPNTEKYLSEVEYELSIKL